MPRRLSSTCAAFGLELIRISSPHFDPIASTLTHRSLPVFTRPPRNTPVNRQPAKESCAARERPLRGPSQALNPPPGPARPASPPPVVAKRLGRMAPSGVARPIRFLKALSGCAAIFCQRSAGFRWQTDQAVAARPLQDSSDLPWTARGPFAVRRFARSATVGGGRCGVCRSRHSAAPASRLLNRPFNGPKPGLDR